MQVRKVLHKDRKFSFNVDKTTECIGSYSESHVVYTHALALVCTFSLVNHTSEPTTPRLGSHFLQVRCNHHRHQIIVFSNKIFHAAQLNRLEKRVHTLLEEATHRDFPKRRTKRKQQPKSTRATAKGIHYPVLSAIAARLRLDTLAPSSRTPIHPQLAGGFKPRLSLTFTPLTAV